MKFDYKTLKRMAESGDTVGRWNGKSVFSTDRKNLNSKKVGAFYILYDDNNKIVRKTTDEWKCYGEVSKDGTVNEYEFPCSYKLMEVSMKYGVWREAEGVYSPGYEVNEKPMGDVRIEMDVDMTLLKAREMSVADLLKGFNYGLD